MSNRFLTRRCAGGVRAGGTQRFLPRVAVPQELLRQVVSDEIANDRSTAVIDPVFTTLLTAPITTTGGDLLIWVSASAGSNGFVTTPEFRLLVDGTLISSASSLMAGVTFLNSIAIAELVTDVVPGAHTVTVEWAKPPGSPLATVMFIFAATLPNRHHGSLIVAELE